MTATSAAKARAFSHIVEEHVENAAFLWLLRAQGTHQCHHTPATLARLEQRINAHLKGLSITPELAWECALTNARAFQEPGELFVLAMVALYSGNRAHVDTVLDLSDPDPECRKAVVSALGWQASTKVYPLLKAWIDSDLAYPRYLALAASSVRRLDPKGYLNRILATGDATPPELLARALRLAGELRRRDLSPALAGFLEHDDPGVAFWAHWCAALLGQYQHLAGMKRFITEPGPYQERAINLGFRCLQPEFAWPVINELINSQQDYQAIIALGALGDPRAAGWLLTRLEDPSLNPIAAESFALMTGLVAPAAPVIPSPETGADDLDDPAPDAPITGYEELVPADKDQLLSQWQHARDQFSAGQRYLLGRPLAQAPLHPLLAQGDQKRRQGAALSLALKESNTPLINVSALQAGVGP